MNKIHLTILVILGLGIGYFSGNYLLLNIIPNLDHKDQPLIDQVFGIKRRQIIGFQPYWLISKADKNYTDYLTTLTYFGMAISSDGTLVKLQTPQEQEPGWTNLKNGKFTAKYNELKDSHIRKSFLVHTANEETISKLLENPQQSAQNIVNDSAPIMREYGFNDLNIDIESFVSAEDEDRAKFTELIKEIKNRIDEENLGTLTIDASPSTVTKKFLIDVKEIEPYFDYIVLMTYDYHYSGSYITGPVAPINGTGIDREFDVEAGLQQALKIIPSKKIFLGIPLYGYEWETLSDKPGSAVIPGSSATASNRRSEELLKTCTDCETKYGEYHGQPYIIYSSEDKKYFKQMFYEDETSLKKKIDLAQKYKLEGLALWALGYEGSSMLNPLKEYKNYYEWSN